MKKAKTFIIGIMAFVMGLTNPVYAENIEVEEGSDITGDAYTSLECQAGSKYCYSGSGVRVSLYFYDKNTKEYKKIGNSHDIWSSLYKYPGRVVDGSNTWTSTSYHYSSLSNSNDGIKKRVTNTTKENGKWWKKNGTTWNGSCSNYPNATDDINATFNKSYDEYIETGIVETSSEFADLSSTNPEEYIGKINAILKEKIATIQKLNDFFGSSLSAVNTEKYFVTIEPIFRIWNNDPDSSRKNNGYIGTVYELSKIYHYAIISNSLRSPTAQTGSFVGDVLKAAPTGLSTNGTGCFVLNHKAYGVGVYKLSDYTSCDCSTATNKYLCAMNYCDANAKESERKNCVINTCGVTDPDFTTCSDDTSTEGTTTSCVASTSSTKTTCTKGNEETYYRTVCDEKSYAYYNDSLPTSLAPGAGFSYSLLLSGTKTCYTYFDTNKWNFDYAVATNSNRTVLNTKLNNYKSLSKDVLEDFKYDSSDAEATIDIEEKVENKSTTTTTKKLKHFTKVTSSDISVSDSTNTFKVMTEELASNNKLFTSSMSSIYSLPEVCINGASGDVSDATYDELSKKHTCTTTSNGPYNKFFTNLKAKTTVNNTTVKITKESSSMDELTNKCYYQVEDKPLSCVIEKNEDIYSLKIYSEYEIDYSKLRYVFSTNQNDENWKSFALGDNTLATLDASDLSQNLTIYGKIKYQGKDSITTICSTKQMQKPTGERCRTKYKPMQYANIMKYCQENWHTDKDNYISEKACYDACTGINSCIIRYTCDETIEKEKFCKDQYDPLTQNTEYRACLNDCVCGGGQAVYRPISLTNPFPSREAGNNWQGYEENIKRLEPDHKPEYVIELNANDISEINKQTERYNDSTKNAYIDYVWATESDTNGKYVSKFIHETNSSLFCIINGEGTCN